MFQHLRACLWLLIVTVVLCCVVYPLVLLGIGKAFFPKQAEGSLIERDGKDVGSRLIAQPFSDDKYFQPRPFGRLVQRRGLRRLELERQQLPAPRPRGAATWAHCQVRQRPEEGPACRP